MSLRIGLVGSRKALLIIGEIPVSESQTVLLGLRTPLNMSSYPCGRCASLMRFLGAVSDSR